MSNQSLLSESVAPSQVDSTSVDKAVSETEDLQGLQMIACVCLTLEFCRPGTSIDVGI